MTWCIPTITGRTRRPARGVVARPKRRAERRAQHISSVVLNVIWTRRVRASAGDATHGILLGLPSTMTRRSWKYQTTNISTITRWQCRDGT